MERAQGGHFEQGPPCQKADVLISSAFSRVSLSARESHRDLFPLGALFGAKLRSFAWPWKGEIIVASIDHHLEPHSDLDTPRGLQAVAHWGVVAVAWCQEDPTRHLLERGRGRRFLRRGQRPPLPSKLASGDPMLRPAPETAKYRRVGSPCQRPAALCPPKPDRLRATNNPMRCSREHIGSEHR